MRAPLALAGLAMIAAGLPLTAPAQAAAPTCQGQPATLVFEADSGFVEGTHGPDVIVASGHTGILARGGDDLICLSGVLQRGTDEAPFVGGGDGTDSVEIRGSDENDQVDIFDVEQVDVRMGGGFDQVRLSGSAGTGTIDGGPGLNAVAAYDFDKVRLDLGAKRLKVDGGDYTVTRFVNGLASARVVRIIGNAAGNKLRGSGCRVTLVGGRGNDVLQARSRDDFESCRPKGARIHGLKGRDRMDGSTLDDVLLGGAGRDTAEGNRGNDRCVAERKRECER
jgi:Ca2+-binding RTX toxin-like protein